MLMEIGVALPLINSHVGWGPTSVMWETYNRPGTVIKAMDVRFFYGIFNAGLK